LARDFLSAERRGFSALSAGNWTAVRLVEGCPANAGQTVIFAWHRKALTHIEYPRTARTMPGNSFMFH